MIRFLVSVWLSVGFFFWNPTTASACSCWSETPRPTRGELAPSKVKIWLPQETVDDILARHGQYRADDTELLDRNGAVNVSVMKALRDAVFLEGPFNKEYPFGITALYFKGIGQLAMLTPREALPIGQFRLRIRGNHPDIPLNPRNSPDISFTVVNEENDVELQPPEVREISWNRKDDQGMCGGFKSASIKLAHKGWLVAYEIYKPSNRGSIPASALRYIQPEMGYIGFGTSACSEWWDFNSESAIVRFGSINLDGKFSGWGPEILLQPPWPKGERPPHWKSQESVMKIERSHGCGCSLGKTDGVSPMGTQAVSAWAILVLGAVYGCIRRKKRRSRTQAFKYLRTAYRIPVL
jgi:hypothetical protein